MSPRHEEQDERNESLEEVSRAYAAAQLDEAPPEHVDRAIRAYAARHARRRARLMPLRPAYLAWAAAAVLSVSVVIELGMLPTRPGIGGTDNAAQLESERTGAALDRAGPTELVQPAPPGARAGEPARLRHRAADAESAVEQREAATSSRRADEDAAAPKASVLAGPQLQRFESSTAAPADEDAGAGRAAADGSHAACPASVRTAPDDWLACIVQLRREQNASTESELAAFEARYPNHPLPRELAPLGR